MAQKRTDTGFVQRNRWWLIVLAIAAGVVILAAFISARRSAVPVHAATVTRGDISSTIDTNGTIEAVNNFEAHAPAPTTIRRILVKAGLEVKAGQLLLALDNANARADAAKALAQVRAAEADLQAVRTGGTREEVLTTESQLVKAQADRQAAQRNFDALQRLVKQGAASPAEVEAAANQVKAADSQVNLLQQKLRSRYSGPEVERVEAQLNEAKASYAAAQDLLQHSEIRAPRAGTVFALPVREGNFVNAGDLLIQVADLRRVQVVGYVDEPDIGRLTVGQKVNVTWDALPGRMWTGAVSQVPTTVIMRGTRTVGEITCVIDNHDARLLPKVNVTVKVITGEHEGALTVPREAVHQDDGRRYVYQIVNGELKVTYIETALSNLTRMEVTSGLSAGALIAVNTTSSASLRDGLQVKIVQR